MPVVTDHETVAPLKGLPPDPVSRTTSGCAKAALT
jgi:hypothetical protein